MSIQGYKKNLLKVIGLLITVLIINTNGYGNSSHVLDNYLCFEDKTGTFTIEQVSDASFQEKFIIASEDIHQQTFSTSTFWFKIDLRDSTFHEPLNIISKNIFIDSLQLFYQHNGEWKSEKSGLLVPTPKNHLTPSIKIPSDITPAIYYLKVRSECLSQLDLWLLNTTELFTSEAIKTIFHIVITGLMVIYLIVSMFLFFLSRKKAFLFLGQYALSFMVAMLYMNGYLFKWVAINSLY